MRQGTGFTDYYKLLGIPPSADTVQIRQAFVRKAKQHHPDVGGSTESMLILNEAYKTLTAPAPKAAYDLLHSFHTGTKEVLYHKVDLPGGHKQNSSPLSDDYIDWFLDSIYNEFNDANKSKLTFGKRVKKALNQFF